jgi:small conductance mechanosensitive channel
VNLTAQNLINQGINIGLKVLGAIALWVIGTWLIGLFMRLLTKSLERQKVDTTHIRYIVSGVTVLLKVILIVSILGYFGIQTTTFAALLAAIGIAIGAAWGGLLANVAAGAFLVFLKPFKIGDLISTAGVLGTVREIGLFVTTIDTLDNVRTYVGNNKLFSDNIQNFTTKSIQAC